MIGPMRCIFGGTDEAGEVDLDRLYGVARHRIGRRPWVGVCMIASLDGSVAVEGRSGGLGNANDRAILAALRDAADVILVGARSAVAEAYRSPRKSGQRIGVVTASGDVPSATDLFTSGSGFLVMPEDGPAGPPGIDIVRAGRRTVDLPLALGRLGDVTESPVFVQAEGGAGLNGALLDADCIDELNLSVAPVLAGGVGSRLIVAAGEWRRRYQPVHVLADDDGYLFTRWVRRRA